jgi:hypothetical protein
VKTNKKLRILVIVLLAFTAFSTGTIAGVNYRLEKIDVVYKNIKIFINDRLMQNSTEPFVIKKEGVTMVPLRDICEKLGAAVFWDEYSNSVFISNSKIAEPSFNYYIPNYSYWNENMPAVKIENIKVLRNVGPFYEKNENIMIAGRSFNTGIQVEVNEENNKAEVVLDLYKQFAAVEGYYGIEDYSRNSSGGCTIEIYGDESLLYQTDIIEAAQYPIWLPPGKIDLRNVNLLKIVVNWKDTGNAGEYKEVTAALGNFKLYKK